MKKQATFVKQSAIYAASRGVSACAGLATTAVLSRWLTPSDFGAFSLSMIIALAANVSIFQWARVRVLTESGSDIAESQRAATIRFFGWLSACLGGVLGIFVLFTSIHEFVLLKLTIVILLPMAWFDLLADLQRSNSRPFIYLVVFVFKGAGTLALTYIACRWFAGPGSVAIAFAAATSLPVLYGFITDRGHPDSAKISAYSEFKQNRSLIVAYSLGTLAGFADRPLLNWLGGSASVGLYSAGAELPRLGITVVMQSVNLAGFPLAARLFNSGDRIACILQLEKNARLLALVGGLVTAALICSAQEVSFFLLGVEYRHLAAKVIPIVSVGTLIQSFRTFYFEHAFLLSRRPRALSLVYLVSVSASVPLGILLFRYYSVTGLAWGYAAGAFVGTIAAYLFGRRHLRLPIPAVVPFSIIALAGLAAFANAIPLILTARIALFITAVLMLIFWSGTGSQIAALLGSYCSRNGLFSRRSSI